MTREQARGIGAGEPRLSAVISCFNYGDYVAQAIASALDQRDSEVIVVDDGSTDGSPAAIASFGERVRVLEQKNSGQAVALNTGFAASRGQAVIFLDADDVLMPGAATAVCDALSERSVVKAHWTMPVIDALGERTGELQDPELVDGDLRELVAREGPLGDSVLSSPPMSGNAFSRDYLAQVMPIPELYRLRPDDYLSSLAPAFGVLARLPPLSLYRAHGENLHLRWDLEQMCEFERRHFALVAGIVAERLAAEGRSCDQRQWRRTAWGLRLNRAVEAIERLVPAGERFALIDEGLLGAGARLRGRPVVAFPEREHAFGGSPASDEQARAELERLREQSVRYVALAWPAFWWLEEYPGLAQELRRGRRLLADEDVVIYGPPQA